MLVHGIDGGIDANTPSFTGFNITAGGVPNTDGLYVSDPNGTELGVVNVVITDPGPRIFAKYNRNNS